MKLLIASVALLALVGGGSKAPQVIGAGRKESPSSQRKGWKRITVSGVSLSFPPGWIVWDLTAKDFKKAMDASAHDASLRPFASQAIQMAEGGQFKLVVLDTKGATPQFVNNANLLVVRVPGLSFEQVLEGNEAQIREMSLTPVKRTRIQIGGLTGACLEATIKSAQVEQIATSSYFVLHGGNLYAFTFTSTKKLSVAFKRAADAIMSTVGF
jgi:hypothetical protein